MIIDIETIRFPIKKQPINSIIDNNIKIHVALANYSSVGVDTEEDYLAIKKIMKYKP